MPFFFFKNNNKLFSNNKEKKRTLFEANLVKKLQPMNKAALVIAEKFLFTRLEILIRIPVIAVIIRL